MALPDTVEESHKMIEELRKENADRRVKGKAFDDAFAEYNEGEREFLLNLVKTTASNPEQGAIGFRDLAFGMVKDPAKFLEGLDIALPTAPPAEENEGENAEENEGSKSMTPEEMKSMLDERDAAAKAEAEEAQRQAGIEEVFAEVEALGFERGSEGFQIMLATAGAQAQAGKEVNMAELAPKIAAATGVELSNEGTESTEGAEGTEGGEEVDATAVGGASAEESIKIEGSGKEHAATAGAGGAGGAAETQKDWIQEAKDSGQSPLDAARARAEARLASAE